MFSDQNGTIQSEVHSHNTRNRNNLITQRFNRSRTQSTWLYRGVQMWNSLPDEVRTLSSKGAFKGSVKRILLEKY